MKRSLVTSALLLGLIHSGQSLGLDYTTNSSPTSAEVDRFANDALFIMNNYDLSGVGSSTFSTRTWATLVSRNVYVTANHFQPGFGSTIRFYETNDPSGNFVLRQVVDGQRIGNTDIYVGILNEPVPVGYAVYEIATLDIADATAFASSPYNGLNAFMIGQSSTGSGFTGTQNVAAGRNELDSWLDNQFAAGASDDAIQSSIQQIGNIPDYEAFLEVGDSGAPVFVDFNDQDSNYDLQLIGTNWYREDQGGTLYNGFTYLGNYDAQIQAIIDANPIPEPGTAIAFCIAGTILTRRRRRD